MEATLMEDLLLKDYMPRSTLVTTEHLLERPKFPAVDAHNHHGFRASAFGQDGPDAWMRGYEDPDVLVRIMDECGIRAAANLTACWGDDLKRLLDRFEGRYPGRFYTFAGVDWGQLNTPDFGEWAAAQLEESIKTGARGLKVFKGLGLWYKDATGEYLSPDDERLDPIWRKAAELGVPVHMHLGDPMPFFQPLDRFNERHLQISSRPEWHHHSRGFVSFQDLVDAGIRLVSRHPQTTFITSHIWWCGGNLEFVKRQMLDKLPNMYTDIAAHITALGRQPYSARKFLIEYQDRILFGTDITPTREGYQPYFRLLETADEYFEAQPGQPLSRIYGLHLPDDVLEKIYHVNVEKLVPGLV
jgi:predicted TIM-barrel fold metal-dependent hydrolase